MTFLLMDQISFHSTAIGENLMKDLLRLNADNQLDSYKTYRPKTYCDPSFSVTFPSLCTVLHRWNLQTLGDFAADIMGPSSFLRASGCWHGTDNGTDKVKT